MRTIKDDVGNERGILERDDFINKISQSYCSL